MTQYLPLPGFIRHGGLRERLIVSLDLGERREALKLADQLIRAVGMFKIGKALYLAGGPEFVREIRRRGAEVFLDLKFHDAPGFPIRAALEATRLGVRMFDLHLPGGAAGAGRVCTEVTRLCHRTGLRRPHILGVAMLADAGRAARQGAAHHGLDGVVELAKGAVRAGLDGVFTSPQEAPRVRAACGRRFIIVTSGAGARDGANGAAGALDAAAAIRLGADYLVIGSPIWRAGEPLRAVREIIEQIDRGLHTPSLSARKTLITRET